jgi:hypothetical protein
MTPKFYKLLDRCLEEAIDYGWRRAHKHDENPDENLIKSEMMHAISIELSEWFDFEEKK